jgi:hypothetical protein
MKIPLIVLSISLSFVSITSAQTSNITVSNYDIETVLSESAKTIDVNLICNISKNDNSSVIQFLLNSESNLYSVTYRDNEDWDEIHFSFNGKDSLLLTTDEKFLKNNYYDLKFEYSFPVEMLNDTLLILDRGHRWYPLIGNQVFTYKLKCQVPKSFSVLSSGNLTEEKNVNDKSVFTWACDKPVFKLPLIVFNSKVYTKTELVTSENDIEFYYLTLDSTKAKNILSQADSILSYFNKTLGKYDRSKLIYFEVSDFEGVNVGSGLLTTGIQTLEMIDKGYKDALILTLAQQWFGAGVFADFNTSGFFFLSISLPHYLRLMYVRDSEGKEAFNNSLLNPLERYKEFAGKESDVPVININMPDTKEKAIVLYAKGPFVLSKIEKEMGSENWKLFLRDLYQNFCGKVMTYADFKNYMAKYDKSGSTFALFEKLMNEKGMDVE